jgi:predicted amidohydrolase
MEGHKELISLAVANGVDLIVFPELSLTGYEPELAEHLATAQDDQRWEVFQAMSDRDRITIGIGMPTRAVSGVQISMLVFQPDQPRQAYAKQHLHEDELPYFVTGSHQLLISMKDRKIAPAICYESMLIEHAAKASQRGTDVYCASVAKSSVGVDKSLDHFSFIAREYAMTVLMSNCVGRSYDIDCNGRSSVWSEKGELRGQLDETHEGLLLFDLVTQDALEVSR